MGGGEEEVEGRSGVHTHHAGTKEVAESQELRDHANASTCT